MPLFSGLHGPAALLILAVGTLVCRADGPAEHVDPAAAISFERQVRPILKAYCLDCHGGEATEGGLDLRLRKFLIRGGQNGAAAVPGDVTASLILHRIQSGEMPPGEKKLPATDAAVLTQWIAAGAPTLRPEPDQIAPGVGISEEERSYWAFQPIRRPDVPAADPSDRIRTPIDALFMQKMRPLGLKFSPDADRRVLIRRACLDLLGLPPTPEQIQAFIDDPSPQAWEHLVDRLLDSPHYGERWGRHWLDAAGYADSEGATNADAERNNAWRYRDYVVRAFQQDKPTDRFLLEQLAGDELAGPKSGDLTPEQIELLTATGFLTMAANGTSSGDDSPAARNQTVSDTIKIISTSLMGLSVGCAQCHDHRYDPISHVDYYRLRAVFEPAMDWQNWKSPAASQVSLYTEADRAKAAEVEQRATLLTQEKNTKQAEFLAAALTQELTKYEQPLRDQLRSAYETAADKRSTEQQDLLKKYPAVNISPGVLYQYNQAAADELKKFDERIAAIRAEKPVEEFLRTVVEPHGHTPTTHRFHRGEFSQPKEPVLPGDLTAASLFTTPPVIPVDDPALPTTGRRLAFARWLTSGQHPLTARVLMNRFWLHHFGRTFVSTPGEFGKLGAAPEHTDILDWLAADFMEGGWTWKRMHRLIMHSTVYRQSSTPDPAMEAIDPANNFYWRKPILRLDAETLRDSILAVGGQLQPQIGGPPTPVKADDNGQIIEASHSGRRSLYVQVRRSQPLAMLNAFDAPVMETNCTIRPLTNSAPQSLLLLNSRFAFDGADWLAGHALNRAQNRPATADDPRLALTLPRMSVWEFGWGFVDHAPASAPVPTDSNSPKPPATVVFHPLKHWTGSSLQAGTALPDPEHGWVLINPQGGHPGDARHAAIRRFHVPAAGRLKISGALSRPAANGDGVQARIVSSTKGLIAEWVVPTGSIETALDIPAVETAEILDLIVDSRDSAESDSFAWTAELSLTAVDGKPLGTWKSSESLSPPLLEPTVFGPAASEAWKLTRGRSMLPEEKTAIEHFAATQFQYLTEEGKGRAPDPLRQVLVNLCQSLLGSNEFLYVD